MPPVSENRFLEPIDVRFLCCKIPSEEWLRVPIEIPLKYTWKEPVLSNCTSNLILRKFDFNLKQRFLTARISYKQKYLSGEWNEPQSQLNIFTGSCKQKCFRKKEKSRVLQELSDVKLWCSEFSNYKSELQNRFQQIEANSNS